MLAVLIMSLVTVVGSSLLQECVVISTLKEALCSNITLRKIPAGLPTDVRKLDISYNQISVLEQYIFKEEGLEGLENIDASFCGIGNIQEGAFYDMINLNILNLSDNKVERLKPLTFLGSSVEELHLERNCLGILEPHTFQGLEETLDKLFLNGNQITTVHPGAFEGLYYLNVLHLESNMIMAFQTSTFKGVPNLRYLSAKNNTLHLIYSKAFEGLSMLEELNLDSNFVSNLRPQSLKGLSNLKSLVLSNNKLRNIQLGMFDGLVSLSSLTLHRNKIDSINKESFRTMKRSLISLDLSHNPLGFLSPDTFNLPHLTYLDLSGCDIKNISAATFGNFASYINVDGTTPSSEDLILILGENKFECDCELQSLWKSCRAENLEVDCIGDPLCDGPVQVDGQDWNVFSTQNCTTMTLSSETCRHKLHEYLLGFVILMIITF